jgi:Fatty acid desaturase
VFETETDVLDWYEHQPRALSKEFVDSIPWEDVGKYPLNPRFLPVMLYMRDIEYFTDMYYKELLRTPTGKDPVIKKFMERWSVEEIQHAEVLNRFLNEAGFPTSEKWQAEAMAKISRGYKINSFFLYWAVKPFGKYFHGAHMAWGAINEISTLQAYRRLSELADHPVLSHLLSAIMLEEAMHGKFYWNIARLKLNQTKFSRDLARFSVGNFWAPVGQGPKPKHETHHVFAELFRGPSGLELFDRTVSQKVERLPGFTGFKAIISGKVAPILLA